MLDRKRTYFLDKIYRMCIFQGLQNTDIAILSAQKSQACSLVIQCEVRFDLGLITTN